MNLTNNRIIFLLLISVLAYTFITGNSLFSLVAGDLDYSVMKGGEFDSNNLDQKQWSYNGCYAPTNYDSFPPGCNQGSGPNIYVNPSEKTLNRLSIGGNHRGTLKYTQNLVGKDIKIRHTIHTPSNCVTYFYGNCNVKDCRGDTRTSLTGTEGKGEFSVISSRLDPLQGIVLFNGQRVCDLQLTQTNKQLEIITEDSRPVDQNGGLTSFQPFLERIPFSCNVNKGSGEVLISEVIPRGRAFDKFTLSFPPEKFCLDFGAYLYDPSRGYTSSPEVYQKLQAGETLTLPFDTKLMYIILNKDPLTGQAYFADPSCSEGNAYDQTTKKCNPIGGFVDLCRNGILDPVRASCIQTTFDECKGVITLKDDGSRVCEQFLPNLNQLCAPQSIKTIQVTNGNVTTCTAPVISCGVNHDLTQISSSEFKCIPKNGVITPVDQSKVEKVSEAAFPSLTNIFKNNQASILIIVTLLIGGIYLWKAS